MKLNHLNLAVPNVGETREFLETYFGMRSLSPEERDTIAVLADDNGLVLTLLQGGASETISYPRSFHIGFIQENEEQVNEFNQRLKEAGFDVKPPRHFHGSWTFYFPAPGGFLIEVLS